jgi:acyl transferase domain-containing protein
VAGVNLRTGDATPGRVGFLFPGQGSQYLGMGADLAMHLPAAQAAWDRAARLGLGDVPLDRVVFPVSVFTDRDRQQQLARLTATEWAQPALAAHTTALLAVLADFGLTPDCVAGHSFGELSALHAAGAFDADTLLRLARKRGELMRDAAAVPGAMLAVSASLQQAEAVTAVLADVWIANHNGPRQVVLSGTPEALEKAADLLSERRIETTWLNTATAFQQPAGRGEGPVRRLPARDGRARADQ